jgi:hypothetical protein
MLSENRNHREKKNGFSHIITVCFVVFTLMKIEDQDLRLDKKRKLTVEFGKNFPLFF